MRAILLLAICLGMSALQAQIQIGSPFVTTNENEWIGWDMDISQDGQVIVISSIAYPNYDNPDGVVRVFKRNDDGWTQLGEDIVVEEANNSFGFAVSLSGNGSMLAIGAPSHDSPITGAGAVYLYEITAADEIVAAGLIEGGSSYQGIGFSIDLSHEGNTVVVGSQETEYATVEVYQQQNGNWQLKGNPLASDVYGDKFGNAVRMDSTGNLIVVLAPSLGPLTGEMPNVKVFRNSGSAWQINSDIITSTDFTTKVQYFELNHSGSLIAANRKSSDYGELEFYTIQDNQLVEGSESITGEVDFNLNIESNAISFGEDGQVIAVEGSNKIKVLRYNGSAWTNEYLIEEPGKIIHGLQLAENGRFMIVSFTGTTYSDREVIVYQLGDLNSVEEKIDPDLEFYPNPVRSSLFLELLGFDYEIIEMETGKVLEVGYANDREVDVSDLMPGVYILTVEKEGETTALKFIKQ